MKTTNQKYFNAQERLVKLLSRKKQPILREEVMALKNIGTVPFNCMVNLLATKTYLKQGATGRARMTYAWNGAKPSKRIVEGMQRAMRLDRMKHEQKKAKAESVIQMPQKNNLEQQVAQLQKAVEGMRPLFINVRDNYEGEFETVRANTQNITRLWNSMHQLERTIEDMEEKCSSGYYFDWLKPVKKPSLLSRLLNAIKWQWRKDSVRLFVYTSLAWITICSAVLTYYNGLSWIL